MVERSIESQFSDLSTNELIELQKAISKTLDGREVSEDVINSAIDYLKSGVRYTKLTLYLEKQGLRREAIARRVVDMWRKNTSMATGGCPIGETESHESPIYPYVGETKYWQICYLQKS